MAGERLAGCFTFAATGMTSSVEIHSKVQVQNRVGHLEHKTRQASGALQVSNVTLTGKSSPLITYTTHDLDDTTLNVGDKQTCATAVFSQQAVGLAGANLHMVATFTPVGGRAGILMKGDLVGGEAPDSEAEQQFTFISTVGAPVWAEAA